MHSAGIMKRSIALFLSLAPAALVHAAGLTFEAPVQEVSAGLEQTELKVDFVFKNDSEESVAIARYEAACTCTSVTVKGGKLRYEPGESGVIRTVFDLGNFVGDTEKDVQMWLEGDAPQQPSVVLKAKIHIPILVNLEPKTLRWEPNGPLDPKVIKVEINNEEPIHLTSVTSGNETFTTEMKTIEDGKSYEVVVTPTSTEKPALGIISLQTDCKIQRQANHRAFAMIRATAQGPKGPGK